MEHKAEKEAEDSLQNTSADRKEASVSTFQEVLSASDLSSARGRISRETRSQSFQGEGQALENILTRQLSNQLDKLELFPRDNERVSVIVPNTPSRSPRTSTPSSSPPPPTLPPRVNQNLGPITLPRNRSLSPSSHSDISSIHGDVFSDPGNLESSTRISAAFAAPGTPLQVPAIVVVGTMEAAEKEIQQKDRRLHFKMRSFDPSMLDEGNVHRCDNKMQELELLTEDLAMSIEDLCLDHAATLGTEKVKELEARKILVESEVRHYQKLMNAKVVEIRENVSTNSIQDGSSYQSESLQLKKKKNDIAQKTLEIMDRDKNDRLSETQREIDLKKAAALAKAANKCQSIFDDCDELSSKINEVEDWEKESNLAISRAMNEIKVWREDLKKIVELRRSLDDIVASYDLSDGNIQHLEAGILVDRVSDDVREAIDAIKKEDDSREL